VTTLSESVGAAISSIGLLGILITPLVQVSKAPWPGEEAAAAEDSATDAKESE
jgi:hypothetical protein